MKFGTGVRNTYTHFARGVCHNDIAVASARRSFTPRSGIDNHVTAVASRIYAGISSGTASDTDIRTICPRRSIVTCASNEYYPRRVWVAKHSSSLVTNNMQLTARNISPYADPARTRIHKKDCLSGIFNSHVSRHVQASRDPQPPVHNVVDHPPQGECDLLAECEVGGVVDVLVRDVPQG